MAFPDDAAQVFRLEAGELLESLEQTLLDLERDPANADLVALAFRSLHTLKGSGAMFGFAELSAFIHQFETAFDRVRKGEVEVSVELIKTALLAADHARGLLTSSEEVDNGRAILNSLEDVIEGASENPAEEAWIVRFVMAPDAIRLGANPLLMLDELRNLGARNVVADIDHIPELGMLEPGVCYLRWCVTIEGSVDIAAIEDVFLFVRDDMELSIERANANASRPRKEPDKATFRASSTPADVGVDRNATIRVPASRLDELMDRVGELVIAQTRLNQLAEAIGNTALNGVAEEIQRLTSGLRDTTMGTRVVPIGTLFGRFRRLVHDLASELGKAIDFVADGEETELDKTVIEQLADPLVHLIRNAVDHGLEATAVRTSCGKAATGTLRISAEHRGAEVALSICDDGAGLDADRIRKRAVQSGLLAEGAEMADAELYRLIFEPGFSTASQVTSLSGRGVGMDVVKRTVEGLRGSIDIDTTPGAGTTITLRLPLTLAIIDGLLVRVGEERYTIPLAAVEECLELPATDDGDAQGRNFLNLRSELVPFLRLRELFSTSATEERFQKVVVVVSGKTRVGLVVDQIIGNNQTVIKQLSSMHSRMKTFSGATILGDGTVALILDVMHLVDFGQSRERSNRLHNKTRRAA